MHEDLEDNTPRAHYGPSGDLTVSWCNCPSSSAPNIVKISLLPVTPSSCSAGLPPRHSDILAPLSLSRPFAFSKYLDRTSNAATSFSWRTTDSRSTDCPSLIKVVTPLETKPSFDVTEAWEPVLYTTSSTSSIEPRSIVSYGIMGTLGRGSYGKVLLAYLKKRPDGNLYAVKTLRKAEMVNYGKDALPGELDTLQMVANASSLSDIGEDDSHGGLFLQRLADHFQDDRFHFMVLEYHPTTLSEPETASRFLIPEQAVTLSASISLPLDGKGCRSFSISYEEACSAARLLAAEISLGLLFLHRNGIVHQDIKPANVMISSAGHVVIGDFGAASRLPHLDSRSSLVPFYTGFKYHGAIVLQSDDFITFTPLYAAPEMRERNSEGLVVYDERADWWSLGVLLYELVTGSAPFNSPSGVDTLSRLRRSDGDHSLSFGHLEKVSLSWRTRGDCGVHLESFIRSLLCHNPTDRLSGHEVLRHHFFDPIQALWNEIAALKHPPCPNPPTSRVDNDISLDFGSTYETPYEEGVFSAEIKVLQPSHTDDFNQSAHYFGYDGIAEKEAVQGLRYCADESEGSSVIQAMPSSASIWFNPGVDSTIQSDVLSSDISGSALHISMDTFNMVRSSATMNRFFNAQRASTPQPQLSDTLGRVDWLKRRDPSQLSELNPCTLDLPMDITLPEEITLSLIEAMDSRDRQEIAVQIGQSQRKTFSGSRKLIKATVQWTWKKLHFW